jgi:hypothetical protein
MHFHIFHGLIFKKEKKKKRKKLSLESYPMQFFFGTFFIVTPFLLLYVKSKKIDQITKLNIRLLNFAMIYN